MGSSVSGAGEPWRWEEPTWREIVGRARAGRSLKPSQWPGGARCAFWKSGGAPAR